MTQFAECYLLIFGQLAVGGIAGLAVPPFAVIERGFYKSSAGIFLGSALVLHVLSSRQIERSVFDTTVTPADPTQQGQPQQPK